MLSKTSAGTFDSAIDRRLRPVLLAHGGLPAGPAGPAAPAAPAAPAVLAAAARSLACFR